MNIILMKRLEIAALDAGRRGDTWDAFWRRHGRDACRAEPHSRRRFAAFLERLIKLVEGGATPDGKSSALPALSTGKPSIPSGLLPAVLPASMNFDGQTIQER